MSLINKERADELIGTIEDMAERAATALLLDGLIDFYNQDPSRLMGSFDLAFFVEILKETVDRISGLLQGTQPLGFWTDEPAKLLSGDQLAISTPEGYRSGHAFNYAATRTDQRIEALLYDLRWRALTKQYLVSGRVKRARPSHSRPYVPGAPDQPFDLLFMVMAVEYALMPGQPARVALEAKLP